MRKIISLFIGAVFLAAFALPVQAELTGFDEDLQLEVVTEVGNFDFPLWFMDAKSLMLQACLDDPELCLQELADIDEENGENGNGETDLFEFEFIYWAAEAEANGFTAHPDADDAARARFILGLEGFVEELDEAEGGGIVSGVFNAVLIHMRGLQPNAQYTITHPFSATPVIAISDARGRLNFADPAAHPEGTPQQLFDIALEGPIQHFLYSDTELPLNVEGEFYIGDPRIEGGHTIFGSPFGINFVRVEGPGLPADGVFADHFVVSGQIFFNEEENLPPLTRFDVAATRSGETVLIDVLANDMMQGDVPVNPTSLERQGAISAVDGGGSVATVRELDKVLLSYTAPATPGLKAFGYTAETFTGMADTADVVVFVEDLQIARADYRTRTGKWSIEGTSSIRDLVVPFVEGDLNKTAYVTGLSGAQEVPPRTTEASGHFSAIFTDNDASSFDFLLKVRVPEGTVMNRAHIHLGETGTNGGILFDLCGEPVNAPEVPCAVSPEGLIEVSGSLTATDFRSVGNVTSFEQAVEALRTGRTYVNVHSLEFPPGEVRGQIGVNVISFNAGENAPAIGAADVQEDGAWSFSGKSVGSPGDAPHMIRAESSLGITETVDLRLR